MQNNISLIERLKEGDRTAFNELYKLHYFSILSYAQLFLGNDEAEDIVQDTFLSIWQHRERIDVTRSFHNYLLRSVYNASINILKRKNYSTEYSSSYKKEIEEIGYSYYNPDTNEIIKKLYNQDLHQQIKAAIRSLPPKCREVFELSYIQDMPSKEISQQLGISLSTVENHIYTALKQLRKKLGPYKAILFLLYYNISKIIINI